MDDIDKNIEEYNANKKRKILIVWMWLSCHVRVSDWIHTL